jgi:hypothetical protein
MPRRIGPVALSLSLLACLPSAAGAVDCGKILGNRVSPCGFESAAQVDAWADSPLGTAAFAAGLGQNGGAMEGVAQDFAEDGFLWSRRSPCFPVSAGQEFSIGYAARLLSRSPIECSVGYQYWLDAACTAPGGGGIVAPRVVGDAGYTLVSSATTVPPGRAALSLILSCEGDYEFRVLADNAFAAPVPSSACLRGDQQSCLHAARFEVQVDWRTDDDDGKARVMEFGGQRTENDESVFWWFFGPQNFEMGVKLLEACVPFLGNKYWVFISGLTDQGWTVRVRDTYTDATRTYVNPIGQLSETFADTAAFDCP